MSFAPLLSLQRNWEGSQPAKPRKKGGGRAAAACKQDPARASSTATGSGERGSASQDPAPTPHRLHSQGSLDVISGPFCPGNAVSLAPSSEEDKHTETALQGLQGGSPSQQPGHSCLQALPDFSGPDPPTCHPLTMGQGRGVQRFGGGWQEESRC